MLWHVEFEICFESGFYFSLYSWPKVGPVEENTRTIITQEFVMPEELNKHFSSEFKREDTRSLPMPEIKFDGPEGEGWGS